MKFSCSQIECEEAEDRLLGAKDTKLFDPETPETPRDNEAGNHEDGEAAVNDKDLDVASNGTEVTISAGTQGPESQVRNPSGTEMREVLGYSPSDAVRDRLGALARSRLRPSSSRGSRPDLCDEFKHGFHVLQLWETPKTPQQDPSLSTWRCVQSTVLPLHMGTTITMRTYSESKHHALHMQQYGTGKAIRYFH